MSNPMKTLIMMAGFMTVLMIAGSYTTSILSANQEDVNVTGTAYEDPYNSSTKIQATTLSFSQYISVFFAVGILVVACGWLMRKY